jgi:hypothetical protein
MNETPSRDAIGDPAVHFELPEDAFDALSAWGRDRAALDDRRDPLVLGALRVLPERGADTIVQRTTGISRSTIARIEAAGRGTPAVTKAHFPDLLLYAGVLRVRADRAQAQANGLGPQDREEQMRLLLVSAALLRVAQRVEDTPPQDLDMQQVAAEFRRDAADVRSGDTDTYDGPIRPTPEQLAQSRAVADVLDEVAEQITRFRLRGDAAFDGIDPELVEAARARSEEEARANNAELFGDRYGAALRAGELVHGSEEEDRAASRITTMAARAERLRAELAELEAAALDLVAEEAPLDALRAAAAGDEQVRRALATVLGDQAAADFLNDQEANR